MVNKAMIFAAGRGTRMKLLTQDRPKPLVRVACKPLIDYALSLVEEARVERIVVNVHYKAEQLISHLAGRNLEVSHEIDQLRETGGGLKLALPLMGDGSVITLNSDAVWTGQNPVIALKKKWDPERMDGLLMLVPPPHAVAHQGGGDFLLGSDQRLTRGAGYIYSGCQIIKTEIVKNWPDDVFSLNPIWDQMIEKKRLFGMILDGSWCDVGSPSGIGAAEKMLGFQDV